MVSRLLTQTKKFTPLSNCIAKNWRQLEITRLSYCCMKSNGCSIRWYMWPFCLHAPGEAFVFTSVCCEISNDTHHRSDTHVFF